MKRKNPFRTWRRFATPPGVDHFETDDDSQDEGGANTLPVDSKGQGDEKDDEGKSDDKGKGDDKELDRVAILEKRLEKERKAREKLEAERQKREDEKKTDLERAKESAAIEQKKREDAERRLEAMVVDSAIRNAIVAAGGRADRIDQILRLVDRSVVEVDEDGDVSGAKEAAESVKASTPEFFGDAVRATSSADTGKGKQSDRGGSDDDGPKTPYEVGRAIAKSLDKKKNRL